MAKEVYTGWCEVIGADCPGGTEKCPLEQQPIDPEICFALGPAPEVDPETPPPVGPG